jgi:hypothetical protein
MQCDTITYAMLCYFSTAGSVYAWGSGYKDSRRGGVPPVLGLGHNDARLTPEKISSLSESRIVSICSGWDHCLALDEAGRVFSWGSGQNGKLGHGADVNVSAPALIQRLADASARVVSISAGCEHSACIDSAGRLFSWGHGEGGRLGHGDNASVNVPRAVAALGKMRARPLSVHCGDKFTLAVVAAAGPAPAPARGTGMHWAEADTSSGGSSSGSGSGGGGGGGVSEHAAVLDGLQQQQWAPEAPEAAASGTAAAPAEGGGGGAVPVRCFDIGRLLLSQLAASLEPRSRGVQLSVGGGDAGAASSALAARAAAAATAGADTDKAANRETHTHTQTRTQTEAGGCVYEREVAYAVELDVVTFQSLAALLALLCDAETRAHTHTPLEAAEQGMSTAATASTASTAATASTSAAAAAAAATAASAEEDRGWWALQRLLAVLERNLVQLGVRARRQSRQAGERRHAGGGAAGGAADLSLASRLPAGSFGPDGTRGSGGRQKAPRGYIDLDEGFDGEELEGGAGAGLLAGGAGEEGFEEEDMANGSFLELCEQLRRDAAAHVPLRSCSDSDSSEDEAGEGGREGGRGGGAAPGPGPRFMPGPGGGYGAAAGGGSNSDSEVQEYAAYGAGGSPPRGGDSFAHTQHQYQSRSRDRRQLNSSLGGDESYATLNSLDSMDAGSNDENKNEFNSVLVSC